MENLNLKNEHRSIADFFENNLPNSTKTIIDQKKLEVSTVLLDYHKLIESKLKSLKMVLGSPELTQQFLDNNQINAVTDLGISLSNYIEREKQSLVPLAFQMIDQKFYPEGFVTEEFEDNTEERPTNLNDRLMEENGNLNKEQQNEYEGKLKDDNEILPPVCVCENDQEMDRLFKEITNGFFNKNEKSLPSNSKSSIDKNQLILGKNTQSLNFFKKLSPIDQFASLKINENQPLKLNENLHYIDQIELNKRDNPLDKNLLFSFAPTTSNNNLQEVFETNFTNRIGGLNEAERTGDINTNNKKVQINDFNPENQLQKSREIIEISNEQEEEKPWTSNKRKVEFDIDINEKEMVQNKKIKK